ELAVGDDRFAGLETAGDDGQVVDRFADDDRPDRDFHVRVHDENGGTLLAGLHRLRRHEDRARVFAQDEGGVDELAGPQAAVGVGELSFEIYRAGFRIDTVIDEAQFSRLERTLLLGQGDLDGELMLGHELAYRRQLLLGNREVNVHGMHLIDDDHRGVGVGLDQVAGVNEQVTGAAVD